MYSNQVNYNNQPTPAYSQMPPPPPFEESQLTPTGSHMDLTALDSPSSDNYGRQYSSDNYGTPVKVNLDLTKFKTKLCRHYTMGQACPFEARCAFAHGFDEQSAARAAADTMAPPPPAYNLATPTQGSGPNSDADLNESQEAQQHHNEAVVESSRPNTPPAYPTRYRYDPYNLHTGMVFAQ